MDHSNSSLDSIYRHRFFISCFTSWKIVARGNWIIKSAKDLFVLIPLGYLSFFLLTVLVGYAFTKIYQEKPKSKEVIGFWLIFGLLFSGSNLLALFAYVDIPLKNLIIYNVVYFIEISAVIFIFYKAMFRRKINKLIWYSILAFFVLIVISIAIQNLT